MLGVHVRAPALALFEQDLGGSGVWQVHMVGVVAVTSGVLRPIAAADTAVAVAVAVVVDESWVDVSPAGGVGGDGRWDVGAVVVEVGADLFKKRLHPRPGHHPDTEEAELPLAHAASVHHSGRHVLGRWAGTQDPVHLNIQIESVDLHEDNIIVSTGNECISLPSVLVTFHKKRLITTSASCLLTTTQTTTTTSHSVSTQVIVTGKKPARDSFKNFFKFLV